jgi:hypothetical protein
MKKIIKPVKKYKTIEDGIEDKVFYQTEDGQLFEDELCAKRHEENIMSIKNFHEKYKHKSIDIDCYSDAVWINNLDDINVEAFKRIFGRGFDCSELKVGWNFIEIDDSGDYTYFYIRQPEDLIMIRRAEIKQIEEFLKQNAEEKKDENR